VKKKERKIVSLRILSIWLLALVVRANVRGKGDETCFAGQAKIVTLRHLTRFRDY
jgi:hypothetical protein